MSDSEVALINEIKAHEATTLALIAKIRVQLDKQQSDAGDVDGYEERKRLHFAEPQRWHSIAKTNIEQGYMALVRSVAQPNGYDE